MPVLDKAAIMAASDVKLEKINVPEWGGDVYLKTLSGTERDAFEDAYSTDRMKNFRPRFLVLTLCDKDGNRLFTDEEVQTLGKKSSAVIAKLFDKAWALNAFRTEDVDTLGKDSPSDQSEGSTSN